MKNPAFQESMQSHCEDQTALLEEIRQHLRDTSVKLDIVTNILKTLPPGEQRERSIALVQNVCDTEVEMLTQIPQYESHTTATLKSGRSLETLR